MNKDMSLTVIAGPCVIENRDLAMETGEEIARIDDTLDASILYKSSFDKANRTSLDSYRGPGLQDGLSILEEVGDTFDLPLTTDIHEPQQAEPTSEVVDVIQIPAFLCRQTDLLVAAGEAADTVNIKKGQFMDPENMTHSVEKVTRSGGEDVWLTERGTVFGYNKWVTDMRNLVIMREEGVKVVFDATHSIQLPGAREDSSGGQREFIAPQARAAVAVGVDAVFLETHPSPDEALCDGPNMLPLEKLEELLETLQTLHHTGREFIEDPLIPRDSEQGED